jgi:magnesium chelatase subunit H
MEGLGLLPIPIFINGVEGHTIVRELLTSNTKEDMVRTGAVKREPTFQAGKAVKVDAIVNSIGFVSQLAVVGVVLCVFRPFIVWTT